MINTRTPEHYKRLGEAIKEERRFLGLSQLRMVEMMGGQISYPSYRMLEQGLYSRISIATERNALLVCEELGIDFETCQPTNRADRKIVKKLGQRITPLQAKYQRPRLDIQTNELKRLQLFYELLGDEIKRLEELAETKKQPLEETKPRVVEIEL